jgi:hypothetical protein
MATQWTLEKELCGIAKTRSAGEALRRLGIVGADSPDAALEEVEAWTCAGDCYTYRFRVLLPEATHEVVLKAVVAFSIARSLTEMAEEWVRRRRLLEREGVLTSKLYHAGRALFVEQSVPLELSDHLRSRPAERKRLADQVIQFAAILSKKGFCPLSPFHALKTDGSDVFVTDFGQDIGPPGVTSRRNGHLLREAVRWLEREGGRSIDRARASALYEFHCGSNRNEETRWT